MVGHSEGICRSDSRLSNSDKISLIVSNFAIVLFATDRCCPEIDAGLTLERRII